MERESLKLKERVISPLGRWQAVRIMFGALITKESSCTMS